MGGEAGSPIEPDNSSDEDRRAQDEKLRRQIDHELQILRAEFAEISPERVTALAEAEFGRLRAGARIMEFIPVLVHRYAREDLLRVREAELRSAA
jgi:hypothetical protein